MTMLLHIYGPNQFYGTNLSVLQRFNSLAPGRSECESKNVIFNLVLLIGIFRSSHDKALRWMPQDLTDDESTLVQVMAWCRQATNHYLSQCWLNSLSPYGITRPQWVHPWLTYIRVMPFGHTDLEMEYSGFGVSISCLLMPWLLKLPEHQQAWYWLCRWYKMYCYPRINFIYYGQAKSKIRFKLWISFYNL